MAKQQIEKCQGHERPSTPPDDVLIERLLIENERLRAALETIRSTYGKVCEEYELCRHVACESSVGAWMEADAALKGAMSPA